MVTPNLNSILSNPEMIPYFEHFFYNSEKNIENKSPLKIQLCRVEKLGRSSGHCIIIFAAVYT